MILEELKTAEQLMYQAKFDDALRKISNLETNITLDSEEHLSIMILKGKVYFYKEEYKKCLEIGELAYELSQKLGIASKSINALLLKAIKMILGEKEQSFRHISEAETLMNALSTNQPLEYLKHKPYFLLIKSIVYHYSADHNKALELALEWLALDQNLTKKLDTALIYYQIGDIHIHKSDPQMALEYAMKSLAIQKELKNNIGIATSLYLIGLSYYLKGEFDEALKFGKKCLAINEISLFSKLNVSHVLGAIYKEKGELNRTLRYYSKAAELAKKEGYLENMLENLLGIGATYRMKGDFNKATEYLQRTITLSKKFQSPYGITSSLFYLILTNLDRNSLDLAKLYLARLEQFTTQNKSSLFKQICTITKALVLKKSSRIRNRTEAELLLKQIIEKGITTPQLYLLSLINLCELFLEELAITNSKDVLDEINPLISRIFKIAEDQNAYLWLAEIKLLQGKLALIQGNVKETEQLLTHAQQIAEMHGLNLLAMKISNEHDNLLEQLNIWDNIEKKNIPMSERIKLASFDSVIGRMQGKRTIEPPKLTHEIPVFLLIIGEGGFPLLSNSFTKELSFEDGLLGGFLSAFDSFSGELFAKRLDRVKFGEYKLLMQSISKFSVCYLFKGQTYLAKQKLKRFVNSLQKSSQIWEKMNKYYNINRVIELKDHPSFESLINKIFIRKIHELKVI
ncbi:MAG: tetratricopeptide repeat protein [Candidatus Hodarchaeota archaeon]